MGEPFGDLGSLKRGTDILVTTTQGDSVYRVLEVARTSLYTGTGPTSASAPVTPVRVRRRCR